MLYLLVYFFQSLTNSVVKHALGIQLARTAKIRNNSQAILSMCARERTISAKSAIQK